MLRWEDTIKIDFQEVVGSMGRIGLSQDWDRWCVVVNAGNERSGSIQCGEFLD